LRIKSYGLVEIRKCPVEIAFGQPGKGARIERLARVAIESNSLSN
jgi:hypothetical protein